MTSSTSCLVGTGISRHFQSESAVIVASGTQLDLRVLLSGALHTRRLPCIGDSAHTVLGHQQVENSVGEISEKMEKRVDTLARAIWPGRTPTTTRSARSERRRSAGSRQLSVSQAVARTITARRARQVEKSASRKEKDGTFASIRIITSLRYGGRAARPKDYAHRSS